MSIMNQEHQQPIFCQSCSMPMLEPEIQGTELNGERSTDYCQYCYSDGAFTQPELTIEDMIGICVPHMVEDGMDASAAEAILQQQLPGLKRWAPNRDRLQPARIEEREALTIAGIAITTTNADEISGKGRIAELWNHFSSPDVQTQLAAVRMDGDVYACYHNYENGTAGRYDLLAGTRVNPSDIAPGLNLGTVAVPAAKYAVFTTETGPVQQVLYRAWEDIWYWFAHSEIERTFSGDFEYYGEHAADPSCAQVDIYIAIK
ncbi:zinc ribbon domain-containing protein [Paenibacillus sp. 1011MAR3C5]|uniref:zinc ribbon domain-containing protein n=1 Tax=Paenibacillus sp. 1011MAR3C5 TaxID=1675787 RepID=UPI002175BB04|nr:zinc ribbon domain-containing protein [Paenibacillus sp. 1011MAR3C5]